MWRPVVEADAMLKYSTCIFVKVVVIALIVSLNIQSIRDIGLNLATAGGKARCPKACSSLRLFFVFSEGV